MTKTVAARNTVDILVPIEVFAFFADAHNDPTWRAGVRPIHRHAEPGQGARYEQVSAGPGARDISDDILVTDYQPLGRVAFETTTGPVRPRGKYTFQDVPGGTRVTFALTADLSAVKALVMAARIQPSMSAEVAGLTNANHHLESRSN